MNTLNPFFILFCYTEKSTVFVKASTDILKHFVLENSLPTSSLCQTPSNEVQAVDDDVVSDESLEVCLFTEEEEDPTPEVDLTAEEESLNNWESERVVVVESPTEVEVVEPATVPVPSSELQRRRSRKQRLSKFIRKWCFCCLRSQVIE